MRKYQLFRIPHPNIAVSPKRYLGREEMTRLFKGEVVVEEKVDGSQMGISWKNGYPYIQTRGSHLIESDKRTAFKGAWSWVWANLDVMEKLHGYLVYGEWLYVRHNLEYDGLPSYFAAFDVWDNKQERFLELRMKQEFLRKVGLASVPLLSVGEHNPDTLYQLVHRRKSNWSTKEFMEGCVVKNYRTKQFGKLVSQEFLLDLDEEGHWTGRTPKFNKLAPGDRPWR